MASTSIVDLLALLGGTGLDDSNDEGRDRFRAFIAQPKWGPDDLGGWIGECVELACRIKPEYYFALQDLVVSFGVHFGFDVEFGSYSGAGASIPFDGRWETGEGDTILIEVKSSPWPMGNANQLGQYMDSYADAGRKDPRHVFGVYAIGTGDFSGVIDQIKGGEYRNRIKVISFADLQRMLALRNLLEEQMHRDRVCELMQDLLLPFESVNVGSVLEIIHGVAILSFAGGTRTQPLSPPPPPNGEWRRSELCEFLRECQPNQVAMMLALCSVPNCELPGEELVRRMSILATVVPGLDIDQAFSPKTIGGTRSGLSKREQQLGKCSVLDSHNGRYFIREEYREWVVDWLRGQGLLPIEIDLEPQPEGLFATVGVAAM